MASGEHQEHLDKTADLQMEARVREWEKAARRRPEWSLWGKAQGGDHQSAIAHPLICHMLDVALVSRSLLDRLVPRAQLERLRTISQMSHEAMVAWVSFLVALHDLGKASPAFQAKAGFLELVLQAAGFDLTPPSHAQYHGTVGVDWISTDLTLRGIPADASHRLARAVAAHHGTFPSDFESDHSLRSRRELGASSVWAAARRQIADLLHSALQVPADVLSAELARDHSFIVFLAGLTSVADWLGSMASVFVYSLPCENIGAYVDLARSRAEDAMRVAALSAPFPGKSRSFVDLFSGYDFGQAWPLHQAAERICDGLDRPSLIVVEAPMGEGKTEAALLLAEHAAARIGHAGIFVGLPTQATANQMLGRVKSFLERAHPGTAANLQLTHGGASLVERYTELIRAVYDEDRQASGNVHAEAWFADKKRALLASHAVGTIDQALLAVLRTRHGFVRLFGLSGKTVILDEVHAYDTYTSTLIERLLTWLSAMGASVILLSATLPSTRRRSLLAAYAGDGIPSGTTAYPRISVADACGVRVLGFGTLRAARRVAINRMGDETEQIAMQVAHNLAAGGCGVWICNTVGRAQSAYTALRELRRQGMLPTETPLVLLHSRLLHGDRQKREVEIERLFGRQGQRPARAIVVGTQVLEQSLDVDFDLMISDVAPIDLLLQRAGRLHRHERTRPSHLAEPSLTIVVPKGDALSCPLNHVARVYEELVMRRTLIALADRHHVCLPADIEPLVEEVYRDEDPPPYKEALANLRHRYETQLHEEHISAKKRALPLPDPRHDIFADLDCPLADEEDPNIPADLRALTRLGDPSIEVVCLHDVAGRACIDSAGQFLVDLTGTVPKGEARRLMENGLRVSTQGLVQALRKQPCPAGWKKQAVLSYRRPLIFHNGAASIAGFHLTLDRELGLVIKREGKPE